MNISVISKLFFVVAMVLTNAFSAGGAQTITKFQGPNNNPESPIIIQSSGKVFLPMISTPIAYYVSTSGSDSNPGTSTRPWRTISKAARVASAGETVYVRGGVYSEKVSLARSGTASAPINFQAFSNETPIISGAGLPMTSWSALVNISGSYINFSGFEVSNSSFIGIILKGTHNVVDRAFAHHSQENGIIITGDYNTVQNSRVWRNALSNENGKAGSWSSGLSAARDTADGQTDYAVMRANTVWENWGEGISSYEANQITIEGNVSHDNYTGNIYVSDTTNVMIRGNLVYMDPASYVYGKGSNVGIMLGDEQYNPPSANITVVNNLAYGNHRNFFWWRGTQGGGMNNVLIAFNTFVNGSGSGDGGNSNVIIGQGITHKNVRFMNNIIQQDSSIPPIGTVAQQGVTYSHNLWSKTPLPAASGAGDVIGNPMLSRSGAISTSQWFALSSSSPAIGKGISLSEVPQDFAGVTRKSPPVIGALEYHP